MGGDIRKLGRHAQRPAEIVPVALRPRHAHAALAHVQIQQLVHVRRVLKQNVLARHADIRRAPLHIDRHVRGLDPEVAQAEGLIFKKQLAVFLVDGRALEACPLKHAQHLLAESPLGKRDIKHGPSPPAAPACRDSRQSRWPRPFCPCGAAVCHTARRRGRRRVRRAHSPGRRCRYSSAYRRG